jgi:hypothetical protein
VTRVRLLVLVALTQVAVAKCEKPPFDPDWGWRG